MLVYWSVLVPKRAIEGVASAIRTFALIELVVVTILLVVNTS